MEKSFKAKTPEFVDSAIKRYENKNGVKLHGIVDPKRRKKFIDNVIESHKKVYDLKTTLSNMNSGIIDPSTRDPRHQNFNPNLGTISYMRDGMVDEAVWLFFLHTHCGDQLVQCCDIDYEKECGLLRAIYGPGGSDLVCTFENFHADPTKFHKLLHANKNKIRSAGKFSNHRKMIAIGGYNPSIIFQVLDSYSRFLQPHKSVDDLFNEIRGKSKDDPEVNFDLLFKKSGEIIQFGRLAQFDFTTRLSYLGIIDAEPGSINLLKATGPKEGAKKLFFDSKPKRCNVIKLQGDVDLLAEYLEIGKHALEDCLCTWQKKLDYAKPDKK